MRTLIFLLILSGLGYVWNSRRERFNEYEGVQTAIKSNEQDISARIKEKALVMDRLRPLREAKSETQAPDGSPEQLEKDIEALKEGIKTATAELDTKEAEYLTVVEAVREKAKKETFPVVKLPSGQELKDCTITKFGEGVVSLSHSDGITRVQADDLPPGWVEKYALDYVSRDSKAEKDFIAAQVDRASTPPLDVKTAKLSEINARIKDLEEQLLSMSAEMRNSRRQTDKLIRDAYRIAMEKGSKGQVAAAQRNKMFEESKKVDAGRVLMSQKYRKLREEKLELERARVELSKRPGT
jgi:hypothetical protein